MNSRCSLSQIIETSGALKKTMDELMNASDLKG